MSGLDTVLRQIRTKTPARTPPPTPPRRVSEDSAELSNKLHTLEQTVCCLEEELSRALKREEQAVSDKEELLNYVAELKREQGERTLSLTRQIESLRLSVVRREQETESPPLKGALELSALVELYEQLPEFPRPVLKIDLTSK